MPLVQNLKARVAEIRRRRPFIDHVMRTVEHYSAVRGNGLAGAVTYFGFLSVFPLLLLAFAVVGWLSGAYADLRDPMVEAIDSVLPGLLGGDRGIDMDVVEKAAGGVAGVGALTMLYTGLNWLDGMRQALLTVFEVEQDEAPGFVKAKAGDLAALVVIGVVLLLSVAISGVPTRASRWILDTLEISAGIGPAVWVMAVGVGLAANTVLFWVIFRVLGNPGLPAKALWSGALLGAIGFELLKQLSSFLLAAAGRQPGFAVFGIALVLLVWINYFSRVVIYAASWAYTSPSAVAQRAETVAREGRVEGPGLDLGAAAVATGRPGEYAPGRRAREERMEPAAAAAVGAGAMLALVAFVRRLSRSR